MGLLSNGGYYVVMACYGPIYYPLHNVVGWYVMVPWFILTKHENEKLAMNSGIHGKITRIDGEPEGIYGINPTIVIVDIQGCNGDAQSKMRIWYLRYCHPTIMNGIACKGSIEPILMVGWSNVPIWVFIYYDFWPWHMCLGGSITHKIQAWTAVSSLCITILGFFDMSLLKQWIVGNTCQSRTPWAETSQGEATVLPNLVASSFCSHILTHEWKSRYHEWDKNKTTYRYSYT